MGACLRCGGLIESSAKICRNCAQSLDASNSLDLDNFDPVIESSDKPIEDQSKVQEESGLKPGILFDIAVPIALFTCSYMVIMGKLNQPGSVLRSEFTTYGLFKIGILSLMVHAVIIRPILKKCFSRWW